MSPCCTCGHQLPAYLLLATPLRHYTCCCSTEFLALSGSEFAGMFLGAVVVWIHYLPHFKTVPEPAPRDEAELLLRRWGPEACWGGSRGCCWKFQCTALCTGNDAVVAAAAGGATGTMPALATTHHRRAAWR